MGARHRPRLVNDGFLGGLFAYFSPAATQWYWPTSCRGRLRSLLHGRGWRISHVISPDGGKS